jgi:hypothetical protein
MCHFYSPLILAVCPNSTVVINTTANTCQSAEFNPIPVSLSDNCVTYLSRYHPFPVNVNKFSVGEFTYGLTVADSLLQNANMAFCTFSVQVKDTTPPTMGNNFCVHIIIFSSFSFHYPIFLNQVLTRAQFAHLRKCKMLLLGSVLLLSHLMPCQQPITAMLRPFGTLLVAQTTLCFPWAMPR